MIRHLILGLILIFTMKTNEKSIKMTPGSEPNSQLERSVLILVQGFSSTIRYDPSSHVLSFLLRINNNKEISPGSSGSSLLPFPYCFFREISPVSSGSSLLSFPYCFLLKPIRHSSPGAPVPPSSLFLIVSS